ncbi:DUF397 domain-containing protein [Streptomyces sp. NPDC057654]|uniref:DUF397 domain-containing protein n=1 Tax=Streptomyces sp. NPDC057654 TaxID=3346196 RepID=UPI003687735C
MSQLKWQRSSFSEPGSDTCVEIAADPSGVARLRESEDPARVVAASAAAFRAFIRAVRTDILAGG